VKKPRFEQGDLVRYFEFEQFHYGEGVLRNTGLGIVVNEMHVSWDDKVNQWIETSTWKTEKVTRYRVHCTDSGLLKSFGARSLELIAKGYIKEV
tara:strand:- start:2717 stop:2998 length:282 start_codon:yes stop_codon:yes gene_type:complete